MSNDNGIVRVFKLWAKISMMIVDGTRDATTVADVLQVILDKSTRSWREEDGVIYFSVTSDGTTGEGWITRLESKGFSVDDYAKQALRSRSFVPTTKVTTKVAVLKGTLFGDSVWTTRDIRVHAEAFRAPDTDRRKLITPRVELACLIREKFMDEEIEAMGLCNIVAMHEHFNASDGCPHLLSVSCLGGSRCLSACDVSTGYGWKRESGFAFAVSQANQ